MADHFYSVTTPGATYAHGNIVVGTSTGGGAIELRVHDGVSGMDKMQINAALRALMDYWATADAPV